MTEEQRLRDTYEKPCIECGDYFMDMTDSGLCSKCGRAALEARIQEKVKAHLVSRKKRLSDRYTKDEIIDINIEMEDMLFQLFYLCRPTWATDGTYTNHFRIVKEYIQEQKGEEKTFPGITG